MKKFFTAMLALMLFTGCSQGTKSSGLKIGINLALTGAYADYGTSEADGALLAIKLKNENGGVNGEQVSYVKLDYGSDIAEATSVQTKLAEVDKVDAILSPEVSAATAAVYPVSNDAKVPNVAASATADGITQDASGKAYEYGWRVCFLDSYQGIAMAKFASKNLGAKKAVIFGDSSSDYAKGLTENFEATFKSLGGTIVASESYVAGDTDFNAALTRISGMDFDVLYIPGYYTEAGLIIKQARALGINKTIIGADGFESPSLLDVAGASALNNVYFTTAYTTVTTDPDVLAFLEAFRKEYNKEPDMFAALAYDAVGLIMDAAERAGSTDSTKINEALAATKGYKGVTGTISFDELHNAVKSVLVVKIVDGVQSESVEVK